MEKYVPKYYEFAFDRGVVGGLARNSHGATLIEELGSDQANQVKNKL